jgi:uncharacterized protein
VEDTTTLPAKPLPTIDEQNAPFWEAAKQGRLAMQQCQQCGHIRFPIQPLCPVCISPDFAWTDLSGRGTVFSKIVYQRAFHPAYRGDVPYNLVIIQLEEGPRMFSNVHENPDSTVGVGDFVEVVFDQATDDIFIPRFRASTTAP